MLVGMRKRLHFRDLKELDWFGTRAGRNEGQVTEF